MTLPATYTILSRTDTGEYLSQFLFFDPESMTWTKDLDEVFCFSTYTNAECNARLILDRQIDEAVYELYELKEKQIIVGEEK